MKRIAVYTALSLILTVPVALAAGETNGMGGQPESSGSMASPAQSGTMAPSAATPSGAMSKSAENRMAQAGPLYGLTAKELHNREIVDPEGNKIGKVGKVAVSRSNDDAYALVKVGGFYGIGGNWAAIPFRDLKMGQNNELELNQTIASKDLPSKYPYQKDGYQELKSDQVASAVLASGAAQEKSDIARFDALDTNHDGTVSKEEAAADPNLEQNWSSADSNGDGKLDPSEFSAFEASQAPMSEPSGGNMGE